MSQGRGHLIFRHRIDPWRGNLGLECIPPDCPKIARREWPPPVISQYAGARTWSAFELGMLAWEIEEQDGAFRIVVNTKRPNGMWLGDPEQTVSFREAVSVDDVIGSAISILQRAARQ